MALVRVTVRGPETVALDTDPGFGEPVRDRLNRFRLRVKAELSCGEVPVVSVRGARSRTVAAPPGSVPSLWPASAGWDLLDSDQVPEGAIVCSPQAWEAVRIQVGMPTNGRDIDEKTIPAESGLVPLAASLTKGCYVGQELVARIDSRGHVNRHLRRLSVDGDVPAGGAGLWDVAQSKQVGTITSASMSALAGHPVALGYIRREVEPGAVLAARWDESEAKVVVNV